MKDLFKEVAANEKNAKWENMIKREKELYSRGNDIRSDLKEIITELYIVQHIEE